MSRWSRNDVAEAPARDGRPPRPRLALTSAALVLATLVGLTLAGCAKRPPQPVDTLLRLSQRNEPATLDPHLATLPDEISVLRALSEGLTAPHPDGGVPSPAAAESWIVSVDGRRHTFRLRRDARWSNGDPVTAADFVYSFRRALDPALASPKAQLFFAVKNAAAYHRGELADFSEVGFTAVNETTLIVETAEPTPYLPALAASGAWLPVHRATLERHAGPTPRDSTWSLPENFVGNGPFVLREWRKGQHLLLVPNPHYHSRTRIGVGSLRFQIYDSGDTEERAFRGGQVDVTMSVPTSKIETYAAPVLQRQPLHETRYFALNLSRPPLNDVRIRRALSLALDRDSLGNHVLRGGQRAALNFIPPGLGGYDGPPRLRRDGDEARRLLAAAGYPDGRGFPRLELSAWGISPTILEAVQQMWRRELGLDIAIVQREGRVHMAALHSGDFTLALMPAIPDYADASALFEEFKTGAPGNFPRWSDAHYDELVTAAGRAATSTQRVELYRAAEDLLLSALPVIPLYFNTQNYLVSPAVHGWRQDELWNRFYLDVTLHPDDPAAARPR